MGQNHVASVLKRPTHIAQWILLSVGMILLGRSLTVLGMDTGKVDHALFGAISFPCTERLLVKHAALVEEGALIFRLTLKILEAETATGMQTNLPGAKPMDTDLGTRAILRRKHAVSAMAVLLLETSRS